MMRLSYTEMGKIFRGAVLWCRSEVLFGPKYRMLLTVHPSGGDWEIMGFLLPEVQGQGGGVRGSL